MDSELSTILQVNAQDVGGGAERIASDLFAHFRKRGLRSYLAVGRKVSDDPDVLTVSTGEGHGRPYRVWRRIADKFGGPLRVLDEVRGRESFHYPATYRIPTLTPHRPDVIHAHNLHGGYFDLRALPWLSRLAPVVLTLHDAWLLSGHCSHSFDCRRWEIGCGECPDLSIYPAVRRDATAFNWQRKRAIYEQSRLFVSTPCEWLMRRVERSMLAPAIVESRVIPNGVDLTVFRPADKMAARKALGIDPDARILLCAASGLRQNEFKDFEMIEAAVRSLDGSEQESIVLLVLGEDGHPERMGDVEVRFVPFEANPEAVARWFQASDIYLHAARAETFPLTVLEALACGVPVVATAVGGIPEQIKSSEVFAGDRQGHAREAGTGILIPPGDVGAMARAVDRLLEDEPLRRRLGENAAEDARRRFDVRAQGDAYLAWYRDIIGREWS